MKLKKYFYLTFTMILLFSFIFSNDIYLAENNQVGEKKSIQKYYRVTASALIIRTKPDVSSERVGKILKNRIVKLNEITDKSDEIEGIKAPWFKITSLDNLEGYIFSGFLKPAEEATDNIFIPSDDFFNLYKSLDRSFEKMEKYFINKYPEIFSKNNKTLIINLKNSKQAKFITTFRDDSDDYGNSGASYTLLAYYESCNYAIINLEEGYEYSNSILLNVNNGSSITVPTLSFKLSPDKKRLLGTIVTDGDYGKYTIQIINISGDKPSLEYNHHTVKHEERKISRYLRFKWVSNNKIEIINKINTGEYGKFVYSSSELVFDGKEWEYIY